MIFCGDIAIPTKEVGEKFIQSVKATGIFKDEVVIGNLEGPLCGEHKGYPQYKLFNDDVIVGFKEICEKFIVSLANNHTYDYPNTIARTKELLVSNGIAYFGMIEEDSVNPLQFKCGGKIYAIFGHCWDLYTKTNPNRLTRDRVVDCSYEDLFHTVSMYAKNHPEERALLFPHWNFDFEELPFPAYIELAHDLIDAGVWAVLGNHTHCVQPFEVYHGHLICYSLGNFCIPDGYFFNGRLKYPEDSKKCYVVNVPEEGDMVTLYEVKTDDNGEGINVLSKKEIALGEDDLLTDRQEVASKGGYGNYFKSFRSKKRLTPVFNSYKKTVFNRIKKEFLICKVRSIRSVISMISDK